MSSKHLEKAIWRKEGMHRWHPRQIKQWMISWEEPVASRIIPRLCATHVDSHTVVVPHGFGAIVFVTYQYMCMSKVTSFFKRASGPSTSNSHWHFKRKDHHFATGKKKLPKFCKWTKKLTLNPVLTTKYGIWTICPGQLIPDLQTTSPSFFYPLPSQKRP